jgi:hypothetical protein
MRRSSLAEPFLPCLRPWRARHDFEEGDDGAVHVRQPSRTLGAPTSCMSVGTDGRTDARGRRTQGRTRGWISGRLQGGALDGHPRAKHDLAVTRTASDR